VSHDPNCIFCKIVAGKIPSRKVYEDDEIFVFHDIQPWAPVHFLMIPKAAYPSRWHMWARAGRPDGPHDGAGAQAGPAGRLRPYPEGGFRIVANTGAEGGQEVHHLHIHVMGGPRPLAARVDSPRSP
jgi:histidine triad (HIT) family protein